MAIPVSPPIVSTRSSSVPLDRVTEDETPDLEFRTERMTVTYKMSVYN